MSRFQVLVASASHDVLHAGGFLILGTLVAVVLKVAVPAEGMAAIAAEPLAAVLGDQLEVDHGPRPPCRRSAGRATP